MSTGSRMVRVVAAMVVVFSGAAACDLGRSTGPAWGDGEWEAMGLDGIHVIDLREDAGTLFAATSQGVYRRTLADSDAWSAAGLSGRVVRAVLPLGGDTLLAATDLEAGGSTTMYRSVDGGASWDAYQNGFGGMSPGEALTLGRLGGGTVLAGGANGFIARSYTGGGDWDVVWGGWGDISMGVHFFHADPDRPGRVWSGGETGAMQPLLLRSDDGGTSWTEVSPFLGGDNAHYSVAVDPAAGAVFTGVEGAVLRSRDDGATWHSVLAPAAAPYFFGLATGPVTGRLYAAGAVNTPYPQDLVVYLSASGGDSWTTARAPAGRQAGVNTVVVVVSDSSEAIILGTSDGVFRFRVSP